MQVETTLDLSRDYFDIVVGKKGEEIGRTRKKTRNLDHNGVK